ncbi:MAG: penicillin-binding protein 2 [Flavobacteriales bacterium]
MKPGNLQYRKNGILAFFIIGGLILLINILKLQLFTPVYKKQAVKNAIKKEIITPVRGSIYDRNGKLLVGNQRSYDLMVIPREVKNLDTAALALYTETDFDYLVLRLKKAKRYSLRRPSILVKSIEKESGMKLLERIHQFPGIYLEERTSRHYPIPIAANVLGYIGSVPRSIIRKKPYYVKTDDIGITGVEQTYEDTLRGQKGERYIHRDKHGKFQGSYEDGKNDIKAIAGKDLHLTLDADLQLYAEQLMNNKKGAVVAIEPSTGEILSLVSSPTYDPNLLIGRKRSKNFATLKTDSVLKPLMDRSLTGQYPPGSTFKLVNALIGLQEGAISSNTSFPCSHGWRFSPRLKIGCHSHRSPLNLNQSIAQSCNAYYCYTFQRVIDKNDETKINYQKWRKYVTSFGLGGYLNNDLHTGRKGKVPTLDYYNRQYRNSWKAPTVISLAIGQDALLVTPIQMANMCAAIANRGHFYTPHILSKIKGEPITNPQFTVPKKIDIEKRHFETVINGMQEVIEGKKGTAKNARVPGIEVCGKTGTAENFTKIDGKRVQLKDHSIFIAFAPKDNPKIALAVYVENAGWGSSFGSPIASLLIEKYLTDSVQRVDLEKKIMDANIIEQDDRY